MGLTFFRSDLYVVASLDHRKRTNEHPSLTIRHSSLAKENARDPPGCGAPQNHDVRTGAYPERNLRLAGRLRWNASEEEFAARARRQRPDAN